MDFALERIRTLEPDHSSEEYLLEIAWLYDRIVKKKIPFTLLSDASAKVSFTTVSREVC